MAHESQSESVTIDKLYDLFKMGMESNQQYLRQNQEQFQRVHESMSQMADKVSELSGAVAVMVKSHEKDQEEKSRLYDRIESLEEDCEEVKKELYDHKLQYANDKALQAGADGKTKAQVGLLWVAGGSVLLMAGKMLFDLVGKLIAGAP